MDLLKHRRDRTVHWACAAAMSLTAVSRAMQTGRTGQRWCADAFCQSYHTVGVKLGCFECHQGRPGPREDECQVAMGRSTSPGGCALGACGRRRGGDGGLLLAPNPAGGGRARRTCPDKPGGGVVKVRWGL
jgi:hypothetical protein